MSGLVRATLAATPSKLQRKLSPSSLWLSHPCRLRARPLTVRHFKPARQAVRVGASSEEETEKYLQSIGVKKDKMPSAMKRLRRCPTEKIRATVEFLRETVGVSEVSLGKIVGTFPALLALPMDNLGARVEFLITTIGVSKADLGKIVEMFPQLLSYTPQNMEEHMKFLIMRVGVGEAELRKMMKTHPQLLGYSVENMEAHVKFLLERARVSEAELGKMVKRHPPVLGFALENMEEHVKFLIETVGVKEAELGKVLKTLPNLLGSYSLENLEGKLKHLCSMGVAGDQLGQMVVKFPSVLVYSVESGVLAAKFRFFKTVEPEGGLKQLIADPRLLASDLETKIKPRYWFFMLKRRQGNPQKTLKIGTMIKITDAKFAEKHAHVSTKEWADFLRICALRLKVMEGNAARVSPPFPSETDGQYVSPPPTISVV